MIKMISNGRVRAKRVTTRMWMAPWGEGAGRMEKAGEGLGRVRKEGGEKEGRLEPQISWIRYRRWWTIRSRRMPRSSGVFSTHSRGRVGVSE